MPYGVKYDSKFNITKKNKTITVYQKIVPNSFKAPKYVASYVQKGQPIKPCRPMRTGKILGITIHNTGDIPSTLAGIKSAAEQYVLATYNGNMGGAMVHYYVSNGVAWQLLNDNEQGWHSGSGNATKVGKRGTQIGGNVDTIAIECIGNSAGAEETTAVLAAYLCDKYGLDPMLDVYTHKDWSGKQCPIWILPHWDTFINRIKTLMGLTTSPKVIDRYVSNGLTFIKAKNFKVVYYDGAKNNYGAKNYINAGFFGVFDNGITLPAGNVCADINLSGLADIAQYYLKKYVTNNKLRFNCGNNFSNQFKTKKVSTLIVNNSGKVHIGEYNSLPTDCKYTISGVPVIRDGVDVSYNNFVKPQGWDTSCMYATHRHFLGLKNNEIWIITGSTTTGNYVSTSEVYNKLNGEGFTDVICLDGGGSYVIAESGKNKVATSGNRRINTVIEF